MSSGSGSLPLWPNLLSAPFSSQLNWVSYQGGSHTCALRRTSSNPSARGCRTVQLSQEIAREDRPLWVLNMLRVLRAWHVVSKQETCGFCWPPPLSLHTHVGQKVLSDRALGSCFYLFHHLPLWFFPARTGIICHCFWDFHCSRWCLLGRTIIYNLPTVQMQSMFLLVKPFFKNSKKFFKTFKHNKQISLCGAKVSPQESGLWKEDIRVFLEGGQALIEWTPGAMRTWTWIIPLNLGPPKT